MELSLSGLVANAFTSSVAPVWDLRWLSQWAWASTCLVVESRLNMQLDWLPSQHPIRSVEAPNLISSTQGARRRACKQVWHVPGMNSYAHPGAVELSRRHPVASWLCAMLHCFGSYILADLLLGEPIIDYFSNSSSILLASGVW